MYVAPIYDTGACHTRFEHSIGVSYLAGVFIEQLRLRQPELEITDAEVRSIAACYGHGATYHTQQTARCTRRATCCMQQPACSVACDVRRTTDNACQYMHVPMKG
jgi:hypothetical protein